MSRRRLRSTTFIAAAVSLLLTALPATAQDAPGGSESHKKQYASSGGKPRHKQYATRSNRSHRDWSGLSVDLGVFRPLNSRVSISNDPNQVGQFNLTGIHLAVTAAYLFQQGHFVLGPRVKLSGGWIEGMPLDYAIRTNAIFTLGGEAGYAIGRWYLYGFGAGGAASVSAERLGAGQSSTVVPAWELGAGLRYALSQRWYAKAEASYMTLGDYRLGNDYIDPKPFVALTAGFGFQFSAN